MVVNNESILILNYSFNSDCKKTKPKTSKELSFKNKIPMDIS